MPRLTPLEVASGLVLGPPSKPVPLPDPPGGAENPREALERVVAPALARPPCLVSFSGGRDSSSVLAVASHVARREGLPLPIPATHRFPDAAGTEESEWQEQVVRHLGLDEWVRVEATTELECIGPVAQSVLRQHGLFWPLNSHFHVPLFEQAAGGSLLTGIGGDEAFSRSSRQRVLNVIGGRVRPVPRDALRLAMVAAPRGVRARRIGRRLPLDLAWLKPDALRSVTAALAAEVASEPLRWSRRCAWIRGLRYVEVGTASLSVLAADNDVQVRHPFTTGEFLSALARLAVGDRYASRTAAMRALVADLLPEQVLGRATKARFDEALWGPHSRTFAAEWDGAGVDEALVDARALRSEWHAPMPSPSSFTLMQALWLRRDEAGRRALPRHREQALDRRV